MVVDKTLEIDLNNLNGQMLDQIDEQLEEIKSFFGDDKTKQTVSDITTTPKSKKEEGLRGIFGKKTFDNILNVGTNPLGFVKGHVLSLLPIIGTALAATGIFAALIKKVNDFQAEFVNNVDNRINVFRSKENQAQIQAGLTQLIITTEAGSAEPRDAYNSFSREAEFDGDREARFQIKNISGND